MSEASSPRREVSRSNQRTRSKNFCSMNHSLIHSNPVPSSLTVSSIVVWYVSQDHSCRGKERTYTPDCADDHQQQPAGGELILSPQRSLDEFQNRFHVHVSTWARRPVTTRYLRVYGTVSGRGTGDSGY